MKEFKAEYPQKGYTYLNKPAGLFKKYVCPLENTRHNWVSVSVNSVDPFGNVGEKTIVFG